MPISGYPNYNSGNSNYDWRNPAWGGIGKTGSASSTSGASGTSGESGTNGAGGASDASGTRGTNDWMFTRHYADWERKEIEALKKNSAIRSTTTRGWKYFATVLYFEPNGKAHLMDISYSVINRVVHISIKPH